MEIMLQLHSEIQELINQLNLVEHPEETKAGQPSACGNVSRNWGLSNELSINM